MDRRIRLPMRHRAWIEHRFGASIDEVTIHAGPAARRVVASTGRGTLACALDGQVFLGDIPARMRWPVLLHECAHVIQQRRWRQGYATASIAAAGAEARAATRAAVEGGRFPVRLAIDAREAAAWGEAGHYYTVYFVALAVGAPERDAFQIAFWAQMPDEILNFDATQAGKEIVADAIVLSQSHAASQSHGGMFMPMQTASIMDDMEKWKNVQTGLHVLTGQTASMAVDGRQKTSRAFNPTTGKLMEFGISLHALGDSYAHQDGEKMYQPVLGHLFDGHAPDRISIARRPKYLEYVGALHDVLQDAYPVCRPGTLSRSETIALLGTIVPPTYSVDQESFSYWMVINGGMMGGFYYVPPQARYKPEPSETTQIGQIRDMAAKHLKSMDDYEPEKKDGVWAKNFKAPSGISFPPDFRMRVDGLAKDWSR